MSRTLGTLLVGLAATLALAKPPSVMVSAKAGKASGDKAVILVTLKVPTGYHIYGPKEKSGIPVAIKVVGPASKLVKADYPKTSTYSQLGERMQVYTGTVTIPVTVRSTAKGKQTVKVEVTTQACNDRTCLPPSTQLVIVKTNFN